MIVLIQGVPGSGKSYEAVVYHVLPALRLGRKVITNVPLNVQAFAEIDSTYANLIEVRSDPDEKTPIFSREEHYSSDWEGVDPDSGLAMHPLFVIDECHEALPPRGVPEGVKNLFAKHRHRGFDIVLMTQSYRDVEKAILSRVDHMIEVRNNKARGLKKCYTRFFYRKVADRKPEDVQYRFYKPEFFKLYQSYTQGGSGLELGSFDVKKWWKHPIFWLGGPVLVALLCVIVYGGLSLAFGWGKKTPVLGAEAVASTHEPAKPNVPGYVVPAAEYPKGLAGLSYAGVVRGIAGVMVLTKDNDGSVVAHSATGLHNSGWDIIQFGPCSILLQRRGAGEKQLLVCK